MHFSRCMVAASESFASGSSITRSVAVLGEKMAKSTVARDPLPESSRVTCRCSTTRPLEKSDTFETIAQSARALVRPKTSAMKIALKLRTEFLPQRLEAGIVADRIENRIQSQEFGTFRIGSRGEFLQGGKSAITIAQRRVNLRYGIKDIRAMKCIFADGQEVARPLRLRQGGLAFTETGERRRHAGVRIRRVRPFSDDVFHQR